MKLLTNLLLLVCFLFALPGCKEEIPPKESVRSVRAIQVADPTEFARRWFPGQAKATKEVELSFQVAGPLTSRPVDVGDLVQKGQLVARILPRDFEVRVEKYKARKDKAEKQYQRYKQLYIRKQVSKEDFDQHKAERDISIAQLKDAQHALNDTYLKAPFDGIVTAVYVENHEEVRAKQPVVRLVDHSQIEMIVNVPESFISSADQIQAAGKALRIRFDAFPDREFEAGIKEIGKEASKTTRTFPVTLIMDQPEDIQILPGMAGRASSVFQMEGQTSPNPIVVPESAVFSSGENKSSVWIIDEESNTVSQREVETGDLLSSGISIVKGLEPGEWIATAGVHFLRVGQEVRILAEIKEEVAK